MARWLYSWWRQADRFEWFTVYLGDLHLQPVARAAIAGITATFSAVSALMLLSPAGPHGTAIAGGATAAIIGVALALFWLFRWPTIQQSRLYVFFGDAAIAIACLSQHDPLAGLTGCYAFVVFAIYIALMHCAKATIFNIVVSVGVATVLTWQTVDQGADAILAACEMAILTILGVGAPIALQMMLHIMASDIAHSDHDALTGLLNRRGFHRHTSRLIDRCADADVGYLAVTMIDLDHFKKFNDSHGHLAGDKILAEVGDALRANCGATAVIARAGGEEFLIADVCIGAKPLDAATLCDAIANTPHKITASAGTSTAPVAHLYQQNRTTLIDRLIAHADAAMYVAKRAGGNQHQLYPRQAQSDRSTLPGADRNWPQAVGR
jgi:diguanylate cyclase (GGDEF)-like protein